MTASIEKSVRVLVIDDEPGLREALSYGLTKRGYEVVTAASGDEAIDKVRDQPFDLAVCDIMMPGKNGLDVLKIIKSMKPEIEFVMATGYATLESAVESMKLGAADYIPKPYSIIHLCNIFDKILERSRLQARVNHLEEVNRLKTDFIATMNHELRTPLTAILGFVGLLIRKTYGDIPERQKDILKRVELNAQQLLQLINDILDLSKLSSNKSTVDQDTFNLADLLQEVVDSTEALAETKSITLAKDCSSSLPLLTDRTKLKQAILNLTANEIKFTAKGSVTLRAKKENDMIRIDVQDTGIGIAAKDLPHLFQEFRQLDSSHTREYMGTGLGLAISKKIAELLGGSVSVKSAPGVGSTFTLFIPESFGLAPKTSVPETTEPLRAPGEKIILCIDDEPDVLKVLQDSLQGSGVRFVGAPSGEEGLRLASQLHPDVITLDIMMPHMDGWSVVRQLKSDPLLKNIPIYVVSIVDNKALALSLGVTDCLVKPFQREQLLEKLKLYPKNKMRQVLLVDDDDAMRQFLIDAFSETDMDVETVGSGEEVIEKLHQLHPDVLLLDLVLPGMSGFDVLQAIEAQVAQQQMLVFVLTDRDLTPQEELFLRSRVHLVLKKRSLDFNELRETVRKSLEKVKRAA